MVRFEKMVRGGKGMTKKEKLETAMNLFLKTMTEDKETMIKNLMLATNSVGMSVKVEGDVFTLNIRHFENDSN